MTLLITTSLACVSLAVNAYLLRTNMKQSVLIERLRLKNAKAAGQLEEEREILKTYIEDSVRKEVENYLDDLDEYEDEKEKKPTPFKIISI